MPRWGPASSADEQGRVLVADILESSDAYRRGLRIDDEIISFAGRPITTPNGFKNALGIFPKGWRVPLTYRRENKTYPLYVRLAGVHGREQLIEKTLGRPAQPMPIPKPGEKPGRAEGRQGPAQAAATPAGAAAEAAHAGRRRRRSSKRSTDSPITSSTSRSRTACSSSGSRPAMPRAGHPVGHPVPGPGRGAWTFVGKLQSGKEVRFRIAGRQGRTQGPGGRFQVDAGRQVRRSPSSSARPIATTRRRHRRTARCCRRCSSSG